METTKNIPIEKHMEVLNKLIDVQSKYITLLEKNNIPNTFIGNNPITFDPFPFPEKPIIGPKVMITPENPIIATTGEISYIKNLEEVVHYPAELNDYKKLDNLGGIEDESKEVKLDQKIIAEEYEKFCKAHSEKWRQNHKWYTHPKSALEKVQIPSPKEMKDIEEFVFVSGEKIKLDDDINKVFLQNLIK